MILLMTAALAQDIPSVPVPPPVVQRAGLSFRIDGKRANWWKVRKVIKLNEESAEQLKKADTAWAIGLGLSLAGATSSIAWMVASRPGASRCTTADGATVPQSGVGLWLSNLLGRVGVQGEGVGRRCGTSSSLFLGGIGLSLASLPFSIKSNVHQNKALKLYQQEVSIGWSDRPTVSWTVAW